MPQDRVLAVRPFWETVPQEERVQLLSVSLEELAARAQELRARALKEQGAPGGRCPGTARAAGCAVGAAAGAAADVAGRARRRRSCTLLPATAARVAEQQSSDVRAAGAWKDAATAAGGAVRRRALASLEARRWGRRRWRREVERACGRLCTLFSCAPGESAGGASELPSRHRLTRCRRQCPGPVADCAAADGAAAGGGRVSIV